MSKKSLFDFANENLDDKQVFDEEKVLGKMKEETKETIIEKIKQYENKSQDEIMQELFSNVQKQKSEGTFNYDKISSMANMIFPYIDEGQKSKIKELLSTINDK